MKKIVLIILMLFVANAYASAQAKTRKLPGIINHPSLNLYAPYMSFDGNALLFVSNDGEDGTLTVSYTSRETDWVQPAILPKHINHRLTYLRGFALSADGKKMYLTSAKSPVVGGYDIMSSELNGSTWSEPQNLNAPINSKTNEGCPSFTPDGNSLYFMRCDKMDQRVASGCKLYATRKKSNGQWEEPKELPASINTGNSQTPRIMADGETMIFSSDRMGSTKGGMDLYVTKLSNGNWSVPVPMDFVNTEKDDQFVSVAALGRYIVKDAPGTRKYNELVEYLIPAEIKPRGVMKVEGFIKDPTNAALPAYISVTDVMTKSRAYSGRPRADGSYMFYVLEGTRYEMSVDPEQSIISFYSKEFDLTSDKIPQKERVNVVLKQPAIGDELTLDLIKFKTNSALLEEASGSEIKRLMRVAKANPQLLFEIQVSMNGYMEDSLQSTPDLTEIRMDTFKTEVAKVDSMGQMVKHDTISLKRIYHNDRTLLQAQSILDYIIKAGGDERNFAIKAISSPALAPVEKRLSIKAVARQK